LTELKLRKQPWASGSRPRVRREGSPAPFHARELHQASGNSADAPPPASSALGPSGPCRPGLLAARPTLAQVQSAGLDRVRQLAASGQVRRLWIGCCCHRAGFGVEPSRAGAHPPCHPLPGVPLAGGAAGAPSPPACLHRVLSTPSFESFSHGLLRSQHLAFASSQLSICIRPGAGVLRCWRTSRLRLSTSFGAFSPPWTRPPPYSSASSQHRADPWQRESDKGLQRTKATAW
jgi:hypothetical protein